MSVAVEIPKVKLSGAAIAAVMVPKTTSATSAADTVTTLTATTAVSSDAGSGQGASGGVAEEGVKTRQKYVSFIIIITLRTR